MWKTGADYVNREEGGLYLGMSLEQVHLAKKSKKNASDATTQWPEAGGAQA